MHRDHIMKIFAKGLGFTVFGNVLGGIMTISLAPFIDQWFIPYIAILFTVFIYLSLLFLAGMKDGQNEAKLLRNKAVESVPKNRWIKLGLILGGIMCVPCIVILLGALGTFPVTGEYLLAFRFICGAFCPAMYIAGVQSLPVTEYPTAYPAVLMVMYLALTPAAAHIGYRFGSGDKSLHDLMYDNKK